MIKGFDAIVGKDARVLILGSMPSVKSLEKSQYYGFKQNRFWKIMYAYFNEKITEDYEDRKKLLLNHGIALWDVIGSCDREGSLDSNIKNVKCNDIVSFIKQNPTICKVICNGKKSYTLYQRYFSSLPLECVYLPSTSNANRSIKEIELFRLWHEQLRKSL